VGALAVQLTVTLVPATFVYAAIAGTAGDVSWLVEPEAVLPATLVAVTRYQ
jgi:hypothetical protein